ncbi:2TM domain-containing protein [Chryseobacterium sp. R2A-55]|uniref:2TM domain-containing protein n=1 Tax=Chryseobacterium sp. R2A-55 TaxID=2744445 RepID=UPI001F2D63C4|nr:2TM domain-containing protein [Chryseobacterium sp. R2A-55]
MSRKEIITLLWISGVTGLFFFLFFTDEKTPQNLAISFLVASLYSFLIGGGNGLVNRFLSKKYSWIDQTRTRTILGVIAILLVNVVLVLFCNYINFILIQGRSPSGFFKGSIGFVNWLIINIALLISTFLHARSFMNEWKKASRKEVVEQKLIAKSANAQFESLKNQLDPHFLFNSLNVLSSLIDENPNQAQRFTSSMSKIYRYVLEQKDKDLVTVEEELDFAKTYCDLLKTRFEDSVSFKFEVKDEVKKSFVVPLSLQLLLENSIKHNYATSAKPLSIRIFSQSGNLIIENNLQAREQVKESAGIGLSNIVQRYSLMTKRNVFIEKSDDHFKVKIPILTEKITEMKTSNSVEMAAYEKAAKRVEELKGFYGNLISYCIFIPFLFLINWKTSPSYWWAFWPMFGWGIGVISHAIKTFGIGNNWEEKQIRKLMEKENNATHWK